MNNIRQRIIKAIENGYCELVIAPDGTLPKRIICTRPSGDINHNEPDRVVVSNAILSKNESVLIDHIALLIVDFADDIKMNNKVYTERVEDSKSAIKKAHTSKSGEQRTDARIEAAQVSWIADIYSTVPRDVFDLLSIFDLEITYDDILSDRVTDQQLDFARRRWLDLIREYRIEAFQELDELEERAKSETNNQEDIEDIQTINQMFRDIPQETDLSQFSTIEKIVTYWPSLMLPAPDVVAGKEHIFEKGYYDKISPTSEVDDTEYQKGLLRGELRNITSMTELETLKKDAEGATALPDYVLPEIDARMNDISQVD
jgi:hypothetical protein